ncbi:MAG: hypothetical protein H6725_18695 [Sandaracinaceae bacterium]|nr:hypothetical protein [Sandaracinaceae bacterium]
MQMLTVSQGPTHHFFALENVLVTYYVQVPPLSALRQREVWLRSITRTHEHIALLVVVDKDAVGPLPGDEFRAVLQAQAAQYMHFTACSAVVLEGSGMWFSLLRAGLRSLGMVTRVSFPVRYFDSVSSAAPFAIECAGARVTPRMVADTLESVRLTPPVAE